MNVPLKTATGTPGVDIPWPADVVAFAAAEGVGHCLAPLLEITRRLFPTTSHMGVFLEEDPEIQDDRHVTFHLQLPGQAKAESRDATFAAECAWNREVLHLCTPPKAFLFRLRLDLKP
jgi:hypothetical protein